MKYKKRAAVFIFAALLLCGTSLARADDCTNPSQPEGYVFYNSEDHVLQFCNGTNWVAVSKCDGGGTGCASPTKPEGFVMYNQDNHKLQYCNGTSWVAVDGGLACAPSGSQKIFITSTGATTWTVPADWNNANNSIEVIGGGGGGFATEYGGSQGPGGGGGAYAKAANVTLTPGATVTIKVGAGGTGGVAGNTSGTNGGDTYFCNSTSNCASISGTAVVAGAKGGKGAINATAAAGGLASQSIGATKYNGGSSGTPSNGSWPGTGGGGAAGPNGAGAKGGNETLNQSFADMGGTGGGGASGGSAGAAQTAGTITGMAGGNNSGGTGGGAGATAGATAGSAGTAGGGGGGGGGRVGTESGNGGAGGAGKDWDSSHGAGGGGGGGGGGDTTLTGGNGGAGGLYGGGGGGSGGGGSAPGGAGAQGLIVIKYTAASSCGVTSGLAGYWKFDEASGTSAADSSGNNNTGTLTNGPTWATGQIGNGVSLDGTNDYVSLGSSDILTGTEAAFSICAWVKPSSTFSAESSIYGRGTGGTGSFVFDAYDGSAPTVETNDGGWHVLTANTPLSTNVWNHVCAVRSSGTLTFYRNGSTDGSGSYVQPSNVGGLSQSISYSLASFPGVIDELRIYNRALSSGEVSSIYNSGNGCSD